MGTQVKPRADRPAPRTKRGATGARRIRVEKYDADLWVCHTYREHRHRPHWWPTWEQAQQDADREAKGKGRP